MREIPAGSGDRNGIASFRGGYGHRHGGGSGSAANGCRTETWWLTKRTGTRAAQFYRTGKSIHGGNCHRIRDAAGRTIGKRLWRAQANGEISNVERGIRAVRDITAGSRD